MNVRELLVAQKLNIYQDSVNDPTFLPQFSPVSIILLFLIFATGGHLDVVCRIKLLTFLNIPISSVGFFVEVNMNSGSSLDFYLLCSY